MSLITAIGTTRLRTATSGGWHLPTPPALRTYAAYVLAISTLFVIGYGGANWLASLRADHLQLYLDAELAIPLLPAAIWIYLSINLLFALPLFRLETDELRVLGRRMIAATVIATLFFLAMPTAPGFARLDVAGTGNAAYALLYALDHPYNCVPSLHITYSTLIVTALTRNAGRGLKAVLGLWLALIMASTVLTHQHHLIDIGSALVLVALIQRAIPASRMRTEEIA